MPKPIALSKNRTVSYVLKDNRVDCEDDRVAFQIRAVPFAVRMDIFNTIAMDATGDNPDARVDVGRKYKLACKHGIVGWSDNFEDGDGGALEWEPSPKKRHGVEVIGDDCLAQLPDDVITELGNAINELSTSDANEVGK